MMAQVVPQKSREIDLQSGIPQTSRLSSTGPTRSTRGESRDYFIVVSNLPFHLDAASCARYKDVYWRPLKDLVRKVINKEDDGRDLSTQVGTPKSVNIEHESPGSPVAPSKCGYAICTVNQELLARRALRWLGGNVWYGWVLSVLICCQTGNECRVLDSRWITVFEEPINLNLFSKINDSSLLRSPPRSPLPPPFLDTVRPDSKVMLPPTTRIQHRFSNAYNWASTNCAAGNTSSNVISLQGHPKHQSYADSSELCPAINIMIQIEDQSWHPYGSGISTPTDSSSFLTPSNRTRKAHFAFSPTAESFPSIGVTAREACHSLVRGPASSILSIQDQVANPYRLIPNGVPINMLNGTRPFPPSSTLLVGNIHHNITPGLIQAYLNTSGFSLHRFEVKETAGPSKKKVTAILGFSSAEEAKRARRIIDGAVFEGRKLSCELMMEVTEQAGDSDETENSRSITATAGNVRGVDNFGFSHTQMVSRGSGPVIANGSGEERAG